MTANQNNFGSNISKHHKKKLNPCQSKVEGGLYPGGGGGIIRCIFCLQVDGSITGGDISRSLRFTITTGITTWQLIRGHSSINPDTTMT